MTPATLTEKRVRELREMALVGYLPTNPQRKDIIALCDAWLASRAESRPPPDECACGHPYACGAYERIGAESRQEGADGVVKCEWCNGVGEVSVEDGNDCWDAPCPKCNGTGRASTHTDVAGHFPATSEPEQCCYRYTNGERCELRRDTHSFCISHAKQIRRALSAGEA